MKKKKNISLTEREDDYCGSKSEKRKEGKASKIQVEEHHLVLGLSSDS